MCPPSAHCGPGGYAALIPGTGRDRIGLTCLTICRFHQAINGGDVRCCQQTPRNVAELSLGPGELASTRSKVGFCERQAQAAKHRPTIQQRYREELGAGIKTGLIRAMAGSGNVVITAAFVLAGTMLALLSSDVINIGQAGSTICLGLIFDMLIVRLFLVMPLARLLGPWFWWPQRVQSRPRPALTSTDAT